MRSIHYIQVFHVTVARQEKGEHFVMETNVVTYEYNSKQQKQYLNNVNHDNSDRSKNKRQNCDLQSPENKKSLIGNSRITMKNLDFYFISHFEFVFSNHINCKYSVT